MATLQPETSDKARRLFSERIGPHLDDAFAFARWLTGSATDAEDVVQESCLRALAAIEQSRVKSARAWLLAIVRNAAFTWMARNRPQRVIVTDDVEKYSPARPAPAQPTPEDGMIADADAAALEQAIDALPLVFREVLVMREFGDLSYREIAEAVSAPVGTVMSRLARARALLIAALREEGR
jgi:RNA polymerase sigma factor (sigma-70 family)